MQFQPSLYGLKTDRCFYCCLWVWSVCSRDQVCSWWRQAWGLGQRRRVRRPAQTTSPPPPPTSARLGGTGPHAALASVYSSHSHHLTQSHVIISLTVQSHRYHLTQHATSASVYSVTPLSSHSARNIGVSLLSHTVIISLNHTVIISLNHSSTIIIHIVIISLTTDTIIQPTHYNPHRTSTMIVI